MARSVGPRPENPLRPVRTPRGSLRQGGTRKVGRMRVRMEDERKSPGPASETDDGIQRVARSLNFIVKPRKGTLATDSKRVARPACGKNFRGD